MCVCVLVTSVYRVTSLLERYTDLKNPGSNNIGGKFHTTLCKMNQINFAANIEMTWMANNANKYGTSFRSKKNCLLSEFRCAFLNFVAESISFGVEFRRAHCT